MVQSRLSLYLNNQQEKKLDEITAFLNDGKSQTFKIMLETFYQLFIEDGNDLAYENRLNQLQRGDFDSIEKDVKQVKRKMDQLLYLQLSNFHSRDENWDIQDLESVHSKLDPQQHELLARIDELIQEDKARGQTIKHSHK